MRRTIEENDIPNVMKMYKFDGPNKNLIKSMISWKYFTDTTSLSERLHDFHRDTKISAPIDRLLKLLISTSREPIFSYYLELSKSVANITQSTIGGELLLLFGPYLLQQTSRRKFTLKEELLSKKLKSSFVSFARKGYV